MSVLLTHVNDCEWSDTNASIHCIHICVEGDQLLLYLQPAKRGEIFRIFFSFTTEKSVSCGILFFCLRSRIAQQLTESKDCDTSVTLTFSAIIVKAIVQAKSLPINSVLSTNWNENRHIPSVSRVLSRLGVLCNVQCPPHNSLKVKATNTIEFYLHRAQWVKMMYSEYNHGISLSCLFSQIENRQSGYTHTHKHICMSAWEYTKRKDTTKKRTHKKQTNFAFVCRFSTLSFFDCFAESTKWEHWISGYFKIFPARISTISHRHRFGSCLFSCIANSTRSSSTFYDNNVRTSKAKW